MEPFSFKSGIAKDPVSLKLNSLTCLMGERRVYAMQLLSCAFFLSPRSCVGLGLMSYTRTEKQNWAADQQHSTCLAYVKLEAPTWQEKSKKKSSNNFREEN